MEKTNLSENAVLYVAPHLPLVYLIGEKEGDEIISILGEQTCSLCCIACPDWNRSLSPWPSPACFKNGEAFAGESAPFLLGILNTVRPKALEIAMPSAEMIAGYSLAGLFALWSMYQTPVFSACMAVSASVWYQGFTDYAAAHQPKNDRSAFYFSIGDKETKTKNPLLSQNEACIHAVMDTLSRQNHDTFFEYNQGNHFVQADERLCKAIRHFCR